MKKILLLAMILAPLLGKAQTLTEYKATNGVTYHLNDTVRLGRGSGQDGSFIYIEDRGLPSPRGSHGLSKTYAHGFVLIKNIKKTGRSGSSKYLFVVDAGSLFNSLLYIDDAISACEVVPCQSGPAVPLTSVADEIKKLKDLLDSGAITQAEYDTQKKKLLGE